MQQAEPAAVRPAQIIKDSSDNQAAKIRKTAISEVEVDPADQFDCRLASCFWYSFE